MKIKELRKKTGLSQKKFGEYLNIPQRTIENWESEKSSPPEYVKKLIEEKLKNDGKIND